ncbi:hypothetical protein CC86DRAFT_464027 [Ophiobolus disseminans]|uniref:Uncharacterized protein n=1 Tax=Ophiobolus disseminans TaxID=1469910 RepID=A0A6A7ADY3_9PLEO|nr:hypothetical protein CC86DRAFT_464027 [Ophiobolus disseminans]
MARLRTLSAWLKGQNMWNEGAWGVPCTFDRAEVEENWSAELDLIKNVGTETVDTSFSYCTECSFTDADRHADPELKAYLDEESQLVPATCNMIGVYDKRENTFDGGSRWMRDFLYTGGKESLAWALGELQDWVPRLESEHYPELSDEEKELTDEQILGMISDTDSEDSKEASSENIFESENSPSPS